MREPTTSDDAGAKGVRFDLTPLAPSESAMKERLESAAAAADSFAARWPIEAMHAIESAELGEVVRELADLRAAREEGRWWAFLLARTDSENSHVLDVQAWVDGRVPRFDAAIRHFELGWLGVAEERATELVLDEAVTHERHYLLSLRRFRPFLLSAAEERALSVREASASTAWASLRGRVLGGLTATFDDGSGIRTWSLSEIQGLRAHPDRELRRSAWEMMRQLLDPVLPIIASCYDAVVADRLAVDALRGHIDPMELTNLANEVEGDLVDSLLAATGAHFELGQRWFAAKAALLGLEQVDTIDLLAPGFELKPIPWDDARRRAVAVLAGITPSMGAEVERFFSERRIDAEPRRGKPYGAMCVSPSTRVPGFIIVNWSGTLFDLVMLTHELGHGTHFALAGRAQSDNSFKPGIAMSEVPSTFAQLRLVEDVVAAGGELARPMLTKTLDSLVGAVFIQVAFARYEQTAYELRAEGQALTHDRLSDICDEELAKVWGDGMTDELGVRRTMWAPPPHFIHERFYTYSYAFAFLLAATLLARSRERGFGERYERFLAAGNSASPEELMHIVGVDLPDPRIWEDGFNVIEGWLEEVSALTGSRG
jgi:oligoendopeptidase F